MNPIERHFRAFLSKHHIPGQDLLDVMDTSDLARFLRVVKA